MKVLLLNGSPHANGCTFTALTEMCKVFAAEGVETEIVQVGNKPVRGCVACGGCKKNRQMRHRRRRQRDRAQIRGLRRTGDRQSRLLRLGKRHPRRRSGQTVYEYAV